MCIRDSYGSGLETEKLEGKVDYKGFVSSDELIATAEGEYGLAWYGSSLELSLIHILDFSTTGFRMFEFFQNQATATFAHDEAVTACTERT